ncbi:OB-fold nucleic acid binding domain-containing protein, partial [Thermodesulfobacteriota bacterium]
MAERRVKINELLQSAKVGTEVHIKGWVRTRRGGKQVNFIAVNDGSTIHSIQVVADVADFDEQVLQQVTTGACIGVTGTLVASTGKGQRVEIHAGAIEVYGVADAAEYP